MSDYTPTTGIVKGAYMIHKFQHEHVELEGSAAEFDRWLAEHDRKVRAEAWEEGCMAGRNREHHKNMTDEQSAEVWPNPYKEQP